MDQTKYEEDNSKNCVLDSPVPACAKSEPCYLGIDEAGRGPVLGPMVYGICYSPVSMKEKFGEMGFADSKTLTEEQREKIFERMDKETDTLLGWVVEILSPTYISNSMLSRTKYNLNALSHDCAIRLIQNALDKGVHVTEVYVDTVGDPVKYQTKLKLLFPEIDITVAKKADSLYPIVGAASICAKVCRDKAVKSWVFSEGITMAEDTSYGSGYPGDPNTKKFMNDKLDKVFGYPQFVRFGWSTASQLIEKQGYPAEWEDDDDDDDDASKNTPALTAFFSKKGEDRKMQRHKYFKDRCLASISEL
ncbi:ribonuclease H2 subunit A-like [Mizuhopecten yessoensis]|uniref:ribonuclease H2 subunit A-like n=1 Tax=Mizuhopecten yessoensis TaxID=6573 RepID=UPI000B45D080|nr:ribonuclease H2 subunit A-like [Mizuhopecten yessoensis]